MTPSEIIAMSRLTTNTGTGVVTDDEAYKFLNIVISDFWADIITMRPGYGMATRNYDTTGVTSYTWATPIADITLSASTFGLQKIEKVGIKYNSNQNQYTPLRLVYADSILNLPDYYETANSMADPIGLLFDTSISIYPTPTSVTNGLQIIGHKKHFPLSATTEDVAGCILIPDTGHSVLVEGLNYYFYVGRGVDFTDIRMTQKTYYESEKLRVINQLADRNQEGEEAFNLVLDHLG